MGDQAVIDRRLVASIRSRTRASRPQPIAPSPEARGQAASKQPNGTAHDEHSEDVEENGLMKREYRTALHQTPTLEGLALTQTTRTRLLKTLISEHLIIALVRSNSLHLGLASSNSPVAAAFVHWSKCCLPAGYHR